jgi:hypothetical protein
MPPMLRPVLLVLLATAGCARFQGVPRGEFEVTYDRWVEHDELVRGRLLRVRAPAPEAIADVVPRARHVPHDVVLLRRTTLPGTGVPIAVAVGRVAEFETTHAVRDVAIAGDAARAWFTPGMRLFVRGMHPGASRLRLTLADGACRDISVAVQ